MNNDDKIKILKKSLNNNNNTSNKISHNIKKSTKKINDIFKEQKEKEQNEKEYQNLIEELNKANNLLDYFLVIGISPEILTQSWLYQSDIDELKTKYKKELEPKIISYFPPITKKTISFDESIINHCFPNGFNLLKENEQPTPKLFSFILDNNYYNLNFPKKYLSCLIFYEKITQYKILYDEYIKLSLEQTNDNQIIFDKNINLCNNNNDISPTSMPISSSSFIPTRSNTSCSQNLKYDNIYIPKCLVIMSLYPYFGEFERILNEIYNYSLGISFEINDKKVEEKQLNSTTIEQKLTFRSSIGNKKTNDIVTMKKVINNEISIPIDKIIENLLIELPVPPRGIYRLEYFLNNHQRKLHQNEMNQLPYVDINLKKIFVDFDIKNIIDIYRHLFLETRLLFFSENIELLNIYIFSFLSFLYPFDYQYQIVTILPKENFEIMESITPFIAGINEAYVDDFFEKLNLTLSDAVLIIDIDNKKINMVNEQSQIPDFPKTYKKELDKNLTLTINKYLKTEVIGNRNFGYRNTVIALNSYRENSFDINSVPKNLSHTDTFMSPNNAEEALNQENDDTIVIDEYSNWKIDYKFNTEIGQIFFNFNAKLLSNYSKHLNLDFYSSNSAPSLELLFKVDNYLKEVSRSDKDFYNKFITETQIFGDFIFMRMIPKNSKEKIHILAFDEKINENSISYFSQPIPSVFTKSTEYNFKIDIVIQKPRELTIIEKGYYKQSKHKLDLLLYGIMTKNTIDDNIIFNYPIFPKLTTDIFFRQNISQFIEPMNLNENIISINEDIILKSHLGGVQMRENDMINYINLCWMQMWGMTFWYCDEKEKPYRFQELLKVINKTSNHEMEIFNLLFETLSVNGTDYMILKLYDILIKLRLNPSLKVHNIAMKILDRVKSGGNFSENLQKFIKNEEGKVYNNINFRKRTLKSKYFKNILTEDILFYAFDACMGMDCNNEINLLSVSQNYKEMARDLIWAKCPKCNEYMLPKLTIQFGKEININGNMKYSTSKYDCIVLFSPLSLKENYNNSLLKDYGIKLDVEDLLEKYSTTFWNTLWYFKINHLEYDFMLPYEHNMDDISFNINQEITTSEIYKLNLNKKQNSKETDIKNINNNVNNKDNDDGILKYEKDELEIYHFEFTV